LVVHARVVDLRMRPVETKEMVRVYRDEVVPAAREQDGFRGAMLLTDPETGIGISITLWETAGEREAAIDGGFYDEKIEKFAALLSETPVRRHYDVSMMV
jgi:heme-degrading monooxygenase HmoA